MGWKSARERQRERERDAVKEIGRRARGGREIVESEEARKQVTAIKYTRLSRSVDKEAIYN